MIAGLLHKHGVWVGNTRTTHFPGTNPDDFGSENLDIKAIMKEEAKRIGYKNWCVPLPDNANIDLKRKKEIDVLLPEKQRWLVKTSWTLAFYRFWMCAYPKALWVFPKRKLKSIIDSMNRHPSMRRRPINMRTKFIEALHERQKLVASLLPNSQYLFVDAYKISRKYLDETEILFAFLRLPIDWKKVSEWIQPENFKK
jgi:hypothetical protein